MAIFSPECDAYARFGDHLIGFKVKGQRLMLMLTNIDTSGNWANSLVNQISLSRDCIEGLKGPVNMLVYPLGYIFGDLHFAKYPALAGMAQGDEFSIKELTV